MAENGAKHKMSCAIDHIIDAENKGEISGESVLYIVENINVAAIETTLWSLEWTIAELVNHPNVQNKIRDEISTTLKGKPVTESNLHELPYLQATINEALRLHTPIPLLVPHMNLEEAKLEKYTIPKESKVVVHAWWLANNLLGGRLQRNFGRNDSWRKRRVLKLLLLVGKLILGTYHLGWGEEAVLESFLHCQF